MPVIPDVISLGPFTAPVLPLGLLLSAYLWYWLAARWAHLWGLERKFLEELVYRALIGGVVGAKLLEILRAPASFIASPRLLVSVPTGILPVLGAVLGALVWAGILLHNRPNLIRRSLDGNAAPFLIGLGPASLLSGGETADVLALGFLSAGAAVHLLRSKASFEGHTALGAVVLGALVVVVADVGGSPLTVMAGISLTQAIAAFIGFGAYLLARRSVGEGRGQESDPGARVDDEPK